MGEIDLIKTVRGLDQSGPGEKAENLDQLWSSLTTSSDKQFHAAEESTLRWLLKVMNGSSPAAETMRRYPLTWRILSCVFERIPLFPLAKSLVDRRFFNILQQAVKDISTPSTDGATTSSGKRKRSTSPGFSLEKLKTPEACIESGQSLFQALGSLLRRVDDTDGAAARDRTGAEHLKLILGTSAAEAVSIAASLLRICNLLLVEGQAEEVDDCGRWIQDVSALWGLHLQGEDDALEIAKHVFAPAAILSQKLEVLPGDQGVSIPTTLRERWSTDLQRMMCGSFIFPARSAFLSRTDRSLVYTALTGSNDFPSPDLSELLPQTAPALYLLASSATEDLVQAGVRKGNAEWMKEVFDQIEEPMRNRDDRLIIMSTVLRQARKKTMPVDTDSLQKVCRDYGLLEGQTEWTLVANLAQCDPDVFHKGEKGVRLLEDVCDRSLEDDVADTNYPAITEVLSAVVRGFRSARDFPSFLKLWYKQLSKLERRETNVISPWQSLNPEVSPWIEQSITARQLTELFEWVLDQKLRGGALCIWLSAICDGLTHPAYTEPTGQTIFDLALKVKKSSSRTTALKWRIAGRAVRWAPIANQDEEEGLEGNLQQNWEKVSDTLKKILKKGALDEAETFEAFKCASTVWVQSAPDGALTKSVGKLVSTFDERLADEASKSDHLHDFLASGERLETILSTEFSPDTAMVHYLAWYFRGTTRLYGFIFKRTGELPFLVRRVLFEMSGCDQGLLPLWRNLWENQQCTDSTLTGEVIDRLIGSLNDLKKDSKWSGKDLLELLRLLSLVPLDGFSVSQREQLMAALIDAAEQSHGTSLTFWKSLLDLGARLMSRTALYKGMCIDHLSMLAATLSKDCGQSDDGQKEYSYFILAFHDFASSTIHQVAEAPMDKRALQFLKGTKAYLDQASEGGGACPLQPTLLKAMRAGLTDSTTSTTSTSEVATTLLAQTDAALGKSVYTTIESWTSNKKLFTKSNAKEDLRLCAAIDACESLTEVPALNKLKTSSLRKLEKRSAEAMREGDARGWKIQTFLQRFLSNELEIPRPATFHHLGDDRESLMRDYVGAIVKSLDAPVMMIYLQSLLVEYFVGSVTNGQLVAIEYVVDRLIENTDQQGRTEDFDLSAAHSELTRALASVKTTPNAILIVKTLHNVLDKKPNAISQWNIESLLSAIAIISSAEDTPVPFEMLCWLMEVVIKKHRLRLEGHFHILLSVLQPLLRNLIQNQRVHQEHKAALFTRLITLICEPTVGAVSRSQNHSALDSATATAKRLAGRHMHLVLMQYVKFQLQTDMSRSVREALEPGMNSIFGILSSDTRKILNDAMDASGRAILREMFKQYSQYGRWKGL